MCVTYKVAEVEQEIGARSAQRWTIDHVIITRVFSFGLSRHSLSLKLEVLFILYLNILSCLETPISVPFTRHAHTLLPPPVPAPANQVLSKHAKEVRGHTWFPSSNFCIRVPLLTDFEDATSLLD